ncbi:hypothetical protein KL928_001494 [Ogataea angusta]|uniref:Uncharacterized protein n=1 Tax=Pichia angusta TaxID=870730 RepID=A0AAN6I615_PICAN|nr:uncharacterized protein KL928_001494 [Ogataea angusta]KAG7820057.1 hypothetical protein KL928_001494 [Ogataea angusta]
MQCRNQPGAKAPKIAPKIVHQEQQNESRVCRGSIVASVQLIDLNSGHGYLSFLNSGISFHDGGEKNIAKKAKFMDHRLDLYTATSAEKEYQESRYLSLFLAPERYRGAKALAVILAEWSIQTPRPLEKAPAPCSRHYLLATADTRAPFSRRNLANLHSNRLRYLDDQLFG